MSFRYPCYPDFKNYAGKVSAIYELIEIAVREFQKSVSSQDSQESFISNLANSYGLNVHFVSCPNLVNEVLNLHIINIHEAFERFLKGLRSESSMILENTWRDYNKKSDLYITLQNVYGSQENAREELGEMQVELCKYYRLVRNFAVHDDKDPRKLEDAFSQVEKFQEQASEEYETIKSAPNSFKDLHRDDFQLFIRVAQDVAWRLSKKLQPNDNQFVKYITPFNSVYKKKWAKSPNRVQKALANLLQKEYGLSVGDADTIVSMVH